MNIQLNDSHQHSQEDQRFSANQSKTHKIGQITFLLTAKYKQTTNSVKSFDEHYNSETIRNQSQSVINSDQNIRNGLNADFATESQLTLEGVDLAHYESVAESEQTKFTVRKSNYIKNIEICQRPQYINYLCQIKWTFLKHLDFSSSNISYIEALSFYDCPMIERLELQNNHIRNLNALGKCQFKHLQYISCHQNPIVQFSLLFRGHFPKLRRVIADSDRIQNDLVRQSYKNTAEHNSLYHIESIFKSQSLFEMTQLKMNTRKRILPTRIKQALRAINPKMKLKNKLTNDELMNKLQRLGGVGTRNDPLQFRTFLQNSIEPVLRDRSRNPNHLYAINQIRQGLWQKLNVLEVRAIQARVLSNNNQPQKGVSKDQDIQIDGEKAQ